MKPIPTLSFEEGRPVLVIDGKPTLLFAGELHNSSASSPWRPRRFSQRRISRGCGSSEAS